jgi:FlaA1/EpsC-like NDP-sugar epimerase
MADALPDGRDLYRGRNVFVSGAGGSIGAELCRQIVACRPARLVLFEVSEVALYQIDRELHDMAASSGVEVVPVLGSVTDQRLCRATLVDHGIDIIFHAAAYKHVPLVEANPLAGIVNNVLGTRALADAAVAAGVARVVLISTDKAVRPTNVMGASKRMAEMVIQDLSRRAPDTVFSMVRFGNVLGSSGSVVPLFAEQIARGGPVTLTHNEVTRYFMTVQEAVSLVLVAGSFAGGERHRGGDVYVLDMGKPVRIRDLAERMIHDAGYTVRDAQNPGGDIEILVTGLRPGEKLHEELLIGEGLLTTPHPRILRAREDCASELDMANALARLRIAIGQGDAAAALDVLDTVVEGYDRQDAAAQRRHA